MKIVLAIIAAIVVVLGGGLVMLGPTIKARLAALSSQGQGIPVRMETVERRDLIETIRAPGRIEPHTKVEISSRIGSEIVALPFREGETVQAGDLVVQLDDRDLKARLLGSQAALESAEANVAANKASRARAESQLNEQLERRKGMLTTLDFAQRTFERKRELYETGDIPLTDLEAADERVEDIRTQIATEDAMVSGAESSLASADANVLQAEAAVKQADAEIKFAEQGLRYTIIRSPIAGRVTSLNAEVGETVVPGAMNQTAFVIMTIADLSRMKMIAEVAESDVVRVQPGQLARVYTIAHGEDRAFDGVIDRIALQRTPTPDGSGYFETEIMLEHEEGELLSGYIANADIEIRTHEGLVVPSQVIVDRAVDDLPQEVIEGSDIVDRSKRVIRVAYCVVDGKTVATPVRIGPSDETHTLIVAGLSEGDVVITGPYKVLDEIKHNAQVRDITAASKAKTKDEEEAE